MRAISRLHYVLSAQFGLDPVRFAKALFALPGYLSDLYRFSSRIEKSVVLLPCLHDKKAPGGGVESEYFWQDLIVAQLINAANPRRHVDVGSRFDGFIAHVASYRQIEVFDVRPIKRVIPNVVFRVADLMQRPAEYVSYADSVSCLHALEHFGLGRYGDPLAPDGYKSGLRHLAEILEPNGTLYLSVPIGLARVEFNANWVFSGKEIVSIAYESSLLLKRMFLIANGTVEECSQADDARLSRAENADYALALFIFEKKML